jgi:hypothetical protein
VAGHSLGGCLSSTLALALADTEQTGSAPWDPSGGSTVSCYSFAGPTAGNATFASYTDQRIGSSLHRYHNTLDIAPSAWNEASLALLPFIYSRFDIKPTNTEIAAILLVMDAVDGGNYQQPSAGTYALQGQVNSADPTYLGQAAYQHSQGYVDILGLSNVFPAKSTAAALTASRDRQLAAFQVRAAQKLAGVRAR